MCVHTIASVAGNVSMLAFYNDGGFHPVTLSNDRVNGMTIDRLMPSSVAEEMASCRVECLIACSLLRLVQSLPYLVLLHQHQHQVRRHSVRQLSARREINAVVVGASC